MSAVAWRYALTNALMVAFAILLPTVDPVSHNR